MDDNVYESDQTGLVSAFITVNKQDSDFTHFPYQI